MTPSDCAALQLQVYAFQPARIKADGSAVTADSKGQVEQQTVDTTASEVSSSNKKDKKLVEA
jgi:hypothetical protein